MYRFPLLAYHLLEVSTTVVFQKPWELDKVFSPFLLVESFTRQRTLVGETSLISLTLTVPSY